MKDSWFDLTSFTPRPLVEDVSKVSFYLYRRGNKVDTEHPEGCNSTR
jgi:hypothetical protein